jgi:hypothetical protein
VIFLSEDKVPGKWRGVFFTVVGLLGLFKVLIRKDEGASVAQAKALASQ